MRIQQKLLLVLATATLSFTSCTPPPALDGWPAADTTQGDLLEDVEYALYLSPQIVGKTPVDRGYLALIKKDGSFESIRTEGLDLGGVFWDDQGIHFADQKTDYLLTNDELVSWPLNKSDHIYGYHLRDTGETIGLYSYGFERDSGRSYTTQVITRQGQDVTSYPVEGSYYTSGVCTDGTIVALSGMEKRRGTEEYLLVVMNEQTQKEEIIDYIPNHFSRTGGNLQCQDRTVYTIVTDDKHGGFDTTRYGSILTWDLDTGQRQEIPVVDQEGNLMPLSHPNGTGWIFLGSQGNQALKDGKIAWYMGSTIYETDAQTGITQELFEISAVKKGFSNSDVIFRETDVVVLSRNFDKENDRMDDIEMIRYDRHSGQELDRVVVKGLVDKVSLDMIPRGFAAKPLS